MNSLGTDRREADPLLLHYWREMNFDGIRFTPTNSYPRIGWHKPVIILIVYYHDFGFAFYSIANFIGGNGSAKPRTQNDDLWQRHRISPVYPHQ